MTFDQFSGYDAWWEAKLLGTRSDTALRWALFRLQHRHLYDAAFQASPDWPFAPQLPNVR